MTKLSKPGTSSPPGVTNAAAPRGPARDWAGRVHASATPGRVFSVWAVCVAITAVVNALSVRSDLTRGGIGFDPLEPWIWELTSGTAMLLLGVPLWWFDGALRTRIARSGWWVLAHVPGSVAFCAAHVALMVGLRTLVYRLQGWHYHFGPWLDGFLYEYRKDVLTYALLVGCLSWWRSSMRPAALPDENPPTEPAPSPPPAPPAEPTFIVRTPHGDVLVRTAEIEWVEAQGNYVALHTASDVRLLRQTLAEMDARLAPHGFVRTHRSALVNGRSVQAIVQTERGAPGVRLASGGVAPLSESRRAEVLRLVAGG